MPSITPKDAAIFRQMHRDLYGQAPDHDPRTRRRPGTPAEGWTRFIIVADRTLGGLYKAYLFAPPTSGSSTITPTSSGSVSAATLGAEDTTFEVHFYNLVELGANTHDLDADEIVWGIPSPSLVASDGLPVYEGRAYTTEDC